MGSGGKIEIVWPTVWLACGSPTTDAQVASGDLGASQPFYFPLWPTYWGFKSRAPVMTGDTLGKEKLASAQQHSIRIYKLSKSYDKMTALKVRVLPHFFHGHWWIATSLTPVCTPLVCVVCTVRVCRR
jgi:hypothetical protein